MTKNAAIVFLVLVNAVLAWTIWSGVQLRQLARQDAIDAHQSAVKEHSLLVRQFDDLTAKRKDLVAQANQSAEPPKTQADRLEDERPEAIAARRDDARAIVTRENRFLFARLSLTPAQRSALIELLLARQVRQYHSGGAGSEGEADAQFRDDVNTVLPPDKAALVTDMVLDHSEAWSEVATLDHVLRYEGKTLTDGQQAAFAALFINGMPTTPPQTLAEVDQRMAQRAAINGRIIDAARRFLDEAQLARFTDELAQGTALAHVQWYRRMLIEEVSRPVGG
jgi:hypothetical protein